jgi:hypothetical protein
MDDERPIDRIELYPFRYYDIRTRRWWKARYVCRLEEIAVRYAAFQITGRPEIRSGTGGGTAGHLARGGAE